MKYLSFLLTTSFLLILAIPNYAQNQNEMESVSGIRAGWNYSQYFDDGTALTGTEHYSSFYAGFFRDQEIGLPLLYLGGGVEYYQNAAKTNDNNRRVLHYVGVPLYLKVKLGPVFALSGFAPSFKVAEQYYLAGNKVAPANKSHWFDAPFFLGAGVKIAMFTVELRYHWGTIDTFETLIGNKGARSQYLQLGAGISL